MLMLVPGVPSMHQPKLGPLANPSIGQVQHGLTRYCWCRFMQMPGLKGRTPPPRTIQAQGPEPMPCLCRCYTPAYRSSRRLPEIIFSISILQPGPHMSSHGSVCMPSGGRSMLTSTSSTTSTLMSQGGQAFCILFSVYILNVPVGIDAECFGMGRPRGAGASSCGC